MRNISDNNTWILKRGGLVIKKKAAVGVVGLNSWERLVYCLWVSDYMMRNAGDFANADDMYPAFQDDAKQFANELSLPVTSKAFSLSRLRLKLEYFDHFEAICEELKQAEPAE